MSAAARWSSNLDVEQTPPRPLDASAFERLGVRQGTSALLPPTKVLSLAWPELERVLPDRGLPRGVVELAMPLSRRALRGGATALALAAVGAVHRGDSQAWCAWLTPADTPPLYAPRVAKGGVDLDRLLVVRPRADAFARTAVKVGTSSAFDLVVVDAFFCGLEGKLAGPLASADKSGAPGARRANRAGRVDGSVIVRKLSLAAEEHGTTFLVLTNAYAPRPLPWPVALRLDVERRKDAIAVRVTRDRYGRASAHGSAHVVRLDD